WRSSEGQTRRTPGRLPSGPSIAFACRESGFASASSLSIGALSAPLPRSRPPAPVDMFLVKPSAALVASPPGADARLQAIARAETLERQILPAPGWATTSSGKSPAAGIRIQTRMQPKSHDVLCQEGSRYLLE